MTDVQELMKLADNYAHKYSFVGDDSMPVARAALESALRQQAAEIERLKELADSEGSRAVEYQREKRALKAKIELLKGYRERALELATAYNSAQEYIEKLVEEGAHNLGLAAERDALQARNDDLVKELAKCRDLMPIPEHGSAIEHAWTSAMADPLSVADWLRENMNTRPIPAQDVNAGTTVDGGALTLALNVLRRAGKTEVADALETTAVRGAAQDVNAGLVEALKTLVGLHELQERWTHDVKSGPYPGRMTPAEGSRVYNKYTAEFPKAWEVAIAALSSAQTAPARVVADVNWVEVTGELLNKQEPWLYGPMWIALKNGKVETGVYEWRQGRKPDRFYTEGGGDLWAFDASHVAPINKPAHPAAPQPQEGGV